MEREERLSEAIRYLRNKGVVKTQEDIAARMGASRSNVSSAKNGRKGVLTDNFIARFCESFKEISYTWLLLGYGDMLSEKEKTVAERIREVLRIESVSLKELGERTMDDFSGLQETIDKDEEPSNEDIEKFCKALKVNEDFIKTGNGEIYESEQGLVNRSALKKHMEALPTRPRLPKNMSEGHLEDYYGKGTKRILCQEKPIITQFTDYDFSLILKNNRMSPRYDRGDEIYFKLARFPEWGNDFLLDTDDGPKFKRILPGGVDADGDKLVRCVSYNKDEYPDFTIKEKFIHNYYRCVVVLRIL